LRDNILDKYQHILFINLHNTHAYRCKTKSKLNVNDYEINDIKIDIYSK